MNLRTLIVYLSISFALSWSIIGFAFFFPDLMESTFGEVSVRNPLFYLAVWTPAIAAFIVVPGTAGWSGFKSCGRTGIGKTLDASVPHDAHRTCPPTTVRNIMSVNPTRRNFLAHSSAVVALTLSGCSINSHRQSALIMPNRHALPESATAHDLVRFATLAASGHNTQPWKFRVGPQEILILPDFERRTPIVDPDDHHLYASLGCAVENLSTAALARGHAGEAVILPEAENGIRVTLATTRAQTSLLFDAIPERQVSRTEFDGQQIDSALLQRLELAGSQYGVQAILITEKPAMEDVLGLIIEGNSRQLDDPAFVAELTSWIRFNPRAAERSGDGLFSAASGNPSLPSWLGPTVLRFVLTKDKENDKTARQIRSSAGLAVFVADRNEPTGWINAGRAYERFALQSTVEGIRHAFVNQAVEVPQMRERLQSLLGLGDARPNLIVRFGYGPMMPESYRRPVDSVIL